MWYSKEMDMQVKIEVLNQYVKKHINLSSSSFGKINNIVWNLI